jgi:hypothetical protein
MASQNTRNNSVLRNQLLINRELKSQITPVSMQNAATRRASGALGHWVIISELMAEKEPCLASISLIILALSNLLPQSFNKHISGSISIWQLN